MHDYSFPMFQVPLISLRTQLGDRGLCCFCSRFEKDIRQHFLRSHAGCGARKGDYTCGEIRGTYFYFYFLYSLPYNIPYPII